MAVKIILKTLPGVEENKLENVDAILIDLLNE